MQAPGGRQQAVRPSNKQETQLAGRQVDIARHIPRQRLGTDTPAQRNKGAQGVTEAEGHLERQMTTDRESQIRQRDRQGRWTDLVTAMGQVQG